MTVESASYISQLNSSNPSASDPLSEGDDHLRLVKSVLQTQFPSLATTAVTQTSAQMNKLGFPVGSVIMYASNSIPTTQTISGINDWLLCNGSAFSTSTYAALYNIIGNVFGTSGSDFLVPDFRTHSPVGVGGSFVLGTTVSATAASGTAVITLQPINFIIKT
jgi:phage-related tail fiber protein|tara:strand:+ start:188 stop:676 length:489 start_codon:yes stop_codon:yes gene_type:complete